MGGGSPAPAVKKTTNYSGRRRRAAPAPRAAAAAAFPLAPAAGLAWPLALADRDPERKIARLRAGAGEDQVAQAGEAGERLGARPESLAEAHELGEAAGRERGRGARAQAPSRHDAGRDRKHILGRA